MLTLISVPGSLLGVACAPFVSRWFGKRKGTILCWAPAMIINIAPIVLRMMGLMPGNESDCVFYILMAENSTVQTLLTAAAFPSGAKRGAMSKYCWSTSAQHKSSTLTEDMDADAMLDRLFLSVRTHDALRMGSTSTNSYPARFRFFVSAPAKHKLERLVSERSRPKILAAPVCVIIGYDLDFPDHMPLRRPHKPNALRVG